MIEQASGWAVPWLIFLAEWSIRWGIVIGVLAVWLAVRPPRRTALRHLLCLAALAVGFLLPVGPRWGVGFVDTSSGSNVPAGSAGAAAPRSTAAGSPRESLAVTSPGDKRESQELARDTASKVRPAREAGDHGAIRARSSAPLDWWQLAAILLSGGWGAVVLIMVVRLAGGWVTLWRLRREAVEIVGESERLVAECRVALGLSRPVRVAAHAGVLSPAVVAGRRAVVLVPPDWMEWPEPDRRGCLLHELAHLARYDDWTKLAQEVVRIPFSSTRWFAGCSAGSTSSASFWATRRPSGWVCLIPRRMRGCCSSRHGGRGGWFPSCVCPILARCRSLTAGPSRSESRDFWRKIWKAVLPVGLSWGPFCSAG